MEISFKNRELRNLCASKNRAKHQLGETLASKLMARLADIMAFNNVDELIVSQILGSVINSGDHIKIEISAKFNIIFCSNHIETPLLDDGNVDWSNVNRIKILNIGVDND